MNTKHPLTTIFKTSQRVGIWLIALTSIGILIPSLPWTAILATWSIGIFLFILGLSLKHPSLFLAIMPFILTTLLAFTMSLPLANISSSLIQLAIAIGIWGSVLSLLTTVMLYVQFISPHTERDG